MKLQVRTLDLLTGMFGSSGCSTLPCGPACSTSITGAAGDDAASNRLKQPR